MLGGGAQAAQELPEPEAVTELVRSCAGLFCDGFESGNLLAWSDTDP